MKRQTITLTNDFHNTTCTIKPEVGEHGWLYLTKSQVARAHRILCGSKECTCGDTLGARPGMFEAIVPPRDLGQGNNYACKLYEA